MLGKRSFRLVASFLFVVICLLMPFHAWAMTLREFNALSKAARGQLVENIVNGMAQKYRAAQGQGSAQCVIDYFVNDKLVTFDGAEIRLIKDGEEGLTLGMASLVSKVRFLDPNDRFEVVFATVIKESVPYCRAKTEKGAKAAAEAMVNSVTFRRQYFRNY